MSSTYRWIHMEPQLPLLHRLLNPLANKKNGKKNGQLLILSNNLDNFWLFTCMKHFQQLLGTFLHPQCCAQTQPGSRAGHGSSWSLSSPPHLILYWNHSCWRFPKSCECSEQVSYSAMAHWNARNSVNKQTTPRPRRQWQNGFSFPNKQPATSRLLQCKSICNGITGRPILIGLEFRKINRYCIEFNKGAKVLNSLALVHNTQKREEKEKHPPAPVLVISPKRENAYSAPGGHREQF